MTEFNFGHPCKINGEVYYLTGDADTVAEVCSNELKAIQALKDSTDTSVDKLAHLKADCKTCIDVILGDGAFDRIFAGRAYTIRDCTALIKYLTSEYADANRMEGGDD